ncbi:hypothetical protein B0T25DRAFT_576981 [Lasiosphaeria hispida]|uniref:Integral membrane protein n=1 Tax=Lasiosphaeria hispida TaxID=260671 RepID=A0AAJ0MH95_9PEZI|nr:hypothetical protein B0T25DRAFT_576981 [Lasiosphaeria hispida]
MTRYNQFAALVARAILDLLLLIPLMIFWVFSLCSATHQTQPVKLAQQFLRAAPPIFSVGVVSLFVVEVLNIVRRYSTWNYPNTYYYTINPATWPSLTASFLISVGEILITIALYMTTLAVVYVAIGKAKWWRLLRIEALVAAAVLIVLATVLFIKNVVMYATLASGLLGQTWLYLIIDFTLLALAIGILGTAIYAMAALRKRDDRTLGNIPTLLWVASTLWLLHCTYSVVGGALSTNPGRIILPSETRARPFLTTFLYLYPAAAVLALLTVIVRRPVWSGSGAVATKDQDAASALRHSDENRV